MGLSGAWRSWWLRRTLLVAALLTAGAMLVAIAHGLHSSTDAGITLERADFLLGGPDRPPPADASWQGVDLPHAWGSKPAPVRSGWYRIGVDLPEPPQESLAILMPRLSMTASVWLNGERLGACGRSEDPISLCWARPVLVVAPASLWKAGANEIHVQLHVLPGSGLLSPLVIAPEARLREIYDARLFLQLWAPAVFSAIIVAAGLFSLSIWWRRREEEKYLWFAVGGLVWIPYVAMLLVRDVPFDPSHLVLAGNLASDWMGVTWILFIHRSYQIDGRWLERLIIPPLALSSVLAVVTTGQVRAVLALTSHLLGLVAMLVVVVMSWLAWRERHRRMMLWIAIMGVGIVVAAVHDVFHGLGHRVLPPGWLLDRAAVPHIQWLPYVALVYCVAVASDLVYRVHHALDAAEHAIVELELRLSRRRKDLEESFVRRRELERAQAAADERERIYRDLHDDLGAKLLSLAIGAENPTQADLARAGLQDLRDIISHSGASGMRVDELLGDLRAEVEQRVAAAELDFRWELAEGLPDPQLPPNVVLNIVRIVREAVTNVLRHAQAGSVVVRVADAAGGLDISVTDDGRGLQVTPGRLGRGRGNMRARAEQIGGRLEWEAPTDGGCCVRLTVPWKVLGVRAPKGAPLTPGR